MNSTTPRPAQPRPAASPRDRSSLQKLPGFARFAFRVVELFHREPLLSLVVVGQRLVLEPLVFLCLLSRRLRVHGLERLAAIPPGVSVLVVANHRSFFDLFVVTWVLLHRGGLRRRVCFPVRANFFYEKPLGLLINVASSGAAMFPPFFRSTEQRDFNAFALGVLRDRLRKPGSLVGFHPEGTRNKHPDPYSLLPARPGAGELALGSRPEAVVVPVFISGLTNDFGREVLDNLRGRRPIWMVVGTPPDLTRWPEAPRLEDELACSVALLAQVAALGVEERALRERENARAQVR